MKLAHAFQGTGKWIVLMLAIALLPVFAIAQPVFSFEVDDIEAYDRTGPWVYDFDGPTFPNNPLLGCDQNWFTFAPSPPFPAQLHYYAEKYINEGATATIVGTAENTGLGLTAAGLTMNLTQFTLQYFKRVNTVDQTLPWQNPGQSGDFRVYSNASGYISYYGVPKLFMNNATFVITTPYPNQAQIQVQLPFWTGNIGTGAVQTVYGYGDLDIANPLSDDTWEALFASSNYKLYMEMVNVEPTATPIIVSYDFDLNIYPATSSPAFATVDLGALDNPYSFPDQNVEVTINSGDGGDLGGIPQYFFVKEVHESTSGTYPGGLNSKVKKFWEIDTSLATFNADISFTAEDSDFEEISKDASAWKLLYRIGGGNWIDYDDATHDISWAGNTITGLGITQDYRYAQFTIASPLSTLPVVLASFNAMVNTQNMISVAWSTASETSMSGFYVHYREANTENSLVCLTPVIIEAHNTADGHSYNFIARELTEPGVYSFWLEAVSMDGNSVFYGPASATINSPDTPQFPDRNLLGDAWPNPFRNGEFTNISVELKSGEQGTITVYNVTGQAVKTIPVNPGIQKVQWDGLDSRGNQCASGIYFFKLSSPSLNQTKRMVILK